MLRRRSFLYIKNHDVDYVEIGGIKWATKNLGANSVTDYGKYYQWADISGYTADQVGSGEGQKYFDWEDYKYSDSDGSIMTKYNDTDGKTVLDLSGDTIDDAAMANMGGLWRIPTNEELQILYSAVTTAWTEDYEGSGVAGMVCTDNTDNTKVLFLPACGQGFEDQIWEPNAAGIYWSSTLSPNLTTNAYMFLFTEDISWETGTTERCSGLSIRPVKYEYIPPVPPPPNYIEIGGIKWATKNLGADSETDTGLYFQWGDTSGYTADQIGTGEGKVDMSAFQTSNHTYKYWSNGSITKYNGTDGLVELELEDDAAYVLLGDSWRMPTEEECQTLINSVWASHIEKNGVHGISCSARTDSSKTLFFPLVGSAGSQIGGYGTWGYYWTKTRYNDYGVSNLLAADSNGRNLLNIYNTSTAHDGGNIFLGMVIRPVYIDYNNYGYADLGLSVKWATMNVGASGITDYGAFFSWGNADPHPLGDNSYIFNQESYSGTSGASLSSDIAPKSNYDMAHVNMGGDWRLPTSGECKELIDGCTWSKLTMDGITMLSGVSRSNGNSILFPYAGLIRTVNGDNYHDYYDGDEDPLSWPCLHMWTSTMKDSDNSYYLYSNSYMEDLEVKVYSIYSKSLGFPVRGVIDY